MDILAIYRYQLCHACGRKVRSLCENNSEEHICFHVIVDNKEAIAVRDSRLEKILYTEIASYEDYS